MLALLFMARADVGYTVRQAAVHVWKTIVTNTPKTTGEILKTLMEQIIISLGHFSKHAPSLPCSVSSCLVVHHRTVPLVERGLVDASSSVEVASKIYVQIYYSQFCTFLHLFLCKIVLQRNRHSSHAVFLVLLLVMNLIPML